MSKTDFHLWNTSLFVVFDLLLLIGIKIGFLYIFLLTFHDCSLNIAISGMLPWKK